MCCGSCAQQGDRPLGSYLRVGDTIRLLPCPAVLDEPFALSFAMVPWCRRYTAHTLNLGLCRISDPFESRTLSYHKTLSNLGPFRGAFQTRRAVHHRVTYSAAAHLLSLFSPSLGAIVSSVVTGQAPIILEWRNTSRKTCNKAVHVWLKHILPSYTSEKERKVK